MRSGRIKNGIHIIYKLADVLIGSMEAKTRSLRVKSRTYHLRIKYDVIIDAGLRWSFDLDFFYFFFFVSNIARLQ